MAIIKFVRKLQRVSSDSYTLNIPKEIIDKFGWREKQRLEVSLSGQAKHIVVKDSKK